jgi:predicted ATP-binding protein involved in virulence
MERKIESEMITRGGNKIFLAYPWIQISSISASLIPQISHKIEKLKVVLIVEVFFFLHPRFT